MFVDDTSSVIKSVNNYKSNVLQHIFFYTKQALIFMETWWGPADSQSAHIWESAPFQQIK